MEITLHLNFKGDCEAAFAFYAGLLGGEVVSKFTYEGSPMADQAPPEWRAKILHARLRIGDVTLMGSDSPPSLYETPKGTSVVVNIADLAEAERVFNALADGGVVAVPLRPTFWANGFGMVTDRFGVPWMINCEKPQ